MLVEQPEGHALAQGVELNALDDDVIAIAATLGVVDEVRFEHLQLQRHGQPIGAVTAAAADQAFARLGNALHHLVLQAVEVLQAIGIALQAFAPGAPEFAEALGLAVFVDQRARHDTGADHVVGNAGDRALGIGVVAAQVTRTIAQHSQGRCVFGVGVCARCAPALIATATCGALEAAFHGVDHQVGALFLQASHGALRGIAGKQRVDHAHAQ